MIKVIIGLVLAVVTGLTLLGRRYLSRRAKLERILVKTRKLEDEQKKYAFDSDDYVRIDYELGLLTEQYKDLNRES